MARKKVVFAFGTDLTELERGFKRIDYKMRKMSANMQREGKILSTAFTAPLAAVGVAGVKASIDFESAFAGVKKTVDATEAEIKKLRSGILDMSKEIPASAEAISHVAEAAGQLGINTDNILSFSRVMIDLGESTNLGSEEAASSLAQFANVTRMSQTDFDRLGSVVVDLGNNLATTEKDIVAMAQRLAGAGSQIGMSESDIMAMSAALSSVGINAEAGGSSFSKLMIRIKTAVATGNEDLRSFASVARMTQKEFKKAFDVDPGKAILAFIGGLSDLEGSGTSAIQVLNDMGITEIRLTDSLLRAAGASDTFSEAMEIGRKAWEQNNALLEEAEKRYGTTGSQLKVLQNRLNVAAIALGDHLAPGLVDVVDMTVDLAEGFSRLSSSTQSSVVAFSAVAAAVGPVLFGAGQTLTLFRSLGKGAVKLYGGMLKAGEALASYTAATTAAKGAVLGLNGAMSTGPMLAVSAALVALSFVMSPVVSGFFDMILGAEKTEGAMKSLEEQVRDTKEALMGLSRTTWDRKIDEAREKVRKLSEELAVLNEARKKEMERASLTMIGASRTNMSADSEIRKKENELDNAKGDLKLKEDGRVYRSVLEEMGNALAKFKADVRDTDGDISNLKESAYLKLRGLADSLKGTEFENDPEIKRILSELTSYKASVNSRPFEGIPSGGAGKKGGRSISEAAKAVDLMRDKIRYLNEDGSAFLPILEEWKGKLKPLSDDWKLVVDLEKQVNDNIKSQNEELAREAEAAAKRAEALSRWEFSQGFTSSEDRVSDLMSGFDGVDMGDPSAWTDKLREGFAEAQSIVSSLVNEDLARLNGELSKGTITQDQWLAVLESLKSEYAEFPQVIKAIEKAQKGVKDTTSDVSDMTKLWANDLARGLADAIVNAKDLGDALRNVAKSIASSALQKLIGGWLGFADGAAFSGGKMLAFADGGVVNSPMIFPFASGIGLMGEAGPEAIMPLKRGVDGKLGVSADCSGGSGGATIIHNYYIQAVDAQSFADVCRRNPGAITGVFAQDYTNNGVTRKVVKGG